MYEDSYLDTFWEDQNEIPDAHDEWDEWEKDRLCEDRELEDDFPEEDDFDGEDDYDPSQDEADYMDTFDEPRDW
jgi:hypothetical protein